MVRPDVEAALIVIEKFWACDAPVLSVTVSVNPNVPLPVGVPEIVACDALSESPGGSHPAKDHLSGRVPPPPETAMEDGAPTVHGARGGRGGVASEPAR